MLPRDAFLRSNSFYFPIGTTSTRIIYGIWNVNFRDMKKYSNSPQIEFGPLRIPAEGHRPIDAYIRPTIILRDYHHDI